MFSPPVFFGICLKIERKLEMLRVYLLNVAKKSQKKINSYFLAIKTIDGFAKIQSKFLEKQDKFMLIYLLKRDKVAA